MKPTDARLPCYNISTAESEHTFDLKHLDGLEHFLYLRSPQGLKTSPGTFQSLMEKLFEEEIREFVITYVDYV